MSLKATLAASELERYDTAVLTRGVISLGYTLATTLFGSLFRSTISLKAAHLPLFLIIPDYSCLLNLSSGRTGKAVKVVKVVKRLGERC